jgi:hypothetical protein
MTLTAIEVIFLGDGCALESILFGCSSQRFEYRFGQHFALNGSEVESDQLTPRMTGFVGRRA